MTRWQPAPALTSTEPGTRAAELVLGGGLFGTFAEFVEELRAAGVPVSTTEVLDATEALRHLPLEDRMALKLGLAASLVKEEGHWRTFEMLFELFFSLQGRAPGDLSTLAGGELATGDGERYERQGTRRTCLPGADGGRPGTDGGSRTRCR